MTDSRSGMRFELTGEVRTPRLGEWYGGMTGPRMADRDFTDLPRPILERVDAGERCPEELQAEAEAAKRKAEDAARREAFHRRHTGVDLAKLGDTTVAVQMCTSCGRVIEFGMAHECPGRSATSQQARRSAPAGNRYLPYSDPEE